MRDHICGPHCRCPGCGRPSLYNRRFGHACSDPGCEFAHGIVVRIPIRKVRR